MNSLLMRTFCARVDDVGDVSNSQFSFIDGPFTTHYIASQDSPTLVSCVWTSTTLDSWHIVTFLLSIQSP